MLKNPLQIYFLWYKSVTFVRERIDPMAGRLFAIGDIHGCFVPLSILLTEKIRLSKEDKVILLGDYIDRGPQSKQVVDLIIGLMNNGYDLVPLMGNHEAMLINACCDSRFFTLWKMNGALNTLKSFGVSVPENLSSLYLDFFRSLKYYISIEDHLFVHAGFNDDLDNPFEDVDYMLWTRKESYFHPILEGKTIVHGHTPITLDMCKQIAGKHSPVINIDTGCVYRSIAGQGCLTAYEVFSGDLFYEFNG